MKTCTIERDYVYPDHHWVMHTSTTFSPEGNLLEQKHRNPTGSEWSVVCGYDHHGRITRKEILADIEASQVFFYYYDALGRLERVVARSGSAEERVCESYLFDRAGRKTVTVYPDPGLRGKPVAVDSELELETSVEASSIVTIFDDRDRPAKRVFYDPNGRVDRRVMMRYDAAGRLVEEGEREPDGSIREDLRNIYRYDADGRLIGKAMCRYAFGTRRKALVYNERGDVIEERQQRTAGMLDHAGDQDWTKRYRHQYDERGNWIERITETVLPGGDSSVSMIERRRLEYY